MVKVFENTGYWAVVLGGSSGFGLASAHKLASHGMNVFIVHRNLRSEMVDIKKEFEALKRHGVHIATANVDAVNPFKQPEILHTIKQAIGNDRIRCVLHSISKGNLRSMGGKSGNLSNDDFMTTVSAMAVSLYDWTRLIFDAGLFADDARIIAFTSEGSSRAWPSYGAVSAAKAALEAISRNIALEFAPYGIRSNCIQAGVSDTASLRMIPGHEVIQSYSEKRNPFHRLTRPEDVADVVYLLCTDEARWINGSVIPVDGGEHIQ